MNLSGRPEDSSSFPLRNANRNPGPSFAADGNPVPRERFFVDFFIPPPPPLPSDSEYSKSDSSSEDDGFELSGLGNEIDIFDISEKIVNNANSGGKSKRRINRNAKKIKMDTILDSSAGGDSDTDSQDIQQQQSSQHVMKNESISSMSSNTSMELRSEIQKVNSEDSFANLINDPRQIPPTDYSQESLTSGISPPEVSFHSEMELTIPTDDGQCQPAVAIAVSSSLIHSPQDHHSGEHSPRGHHSGEHSPRGHHSGEHSPRGYHSGEHSPRSTPHSPRPTSPTHSSSSSDGRRYHSPHMQNTISERVISPLPLLVESDNLSPNERLSREQSPVALANDVATFLNESPVKIGHVLSPYLNSPKQTDSDEEPVVKPIPHDDVVLPVSEEEKMLTPVPTVDSDSSSTHHVQIDLHKSSDIPSFLNDHNPDPSSKPNRLSMTLNSSTLSAQGDTIAPKRTGSIFYPFVTSETLLSPVEQTEEQKIDDLSFDIDEVDVSGTSHSESSECHLESEPEGEKRLRRVGRFGKSSILIDKQKMLLEDLERGDYGEIVEIVNEIVNKLKSNKKLVEEINVEEMLSTIRKLLVVHNMYIRCSALRLLRYICINEAIIDRIFKLKIHIFIIMSLERSDKLLYERESALSLVTFMVINYTYAIPRSLILSILNIANDPTDSLRVECLKLILRLMMHVPERVVFCDGAQVLLNGCVETNNCSLLQSSILACLFYLDSAELRQKKTVLDLQIILDPLLIESKSVPESKKNDLQVSRYISNIALLTILRTWSGIFIFSGDMNGLNSYINILETHGEEEPELAKQMLSVLFTVIGVATPSYLEEDNNTSTNNLYWNNCSMFISSISKNRTITDHYSGVNLLSSYLSIIVWSLVNSKLPEILSYLMVSADNEVAFLAKNLLRSLVHLSSVFVCMSDVTTRKTSQQAIQTFQTFDNDSLEDLKRKARARNCFIDIGSTSSHLYPVLEKDTFVPCNLTTIFSSFSLLHCVIDCFCDETKSRQPYIHIIDYLCSQGIPFQSYVSSSYSRICENESYFIEMVKRVEAMLSGPFDHWDWRMILECLLIAVTNPRFINIVAENMVYRLDNQLSIYAERRFFSIPNKPINSQSPIYATCIALWYIIVVLADPAKVPLQRKNRVMKYGVDQFLMQLEDAKNNKTSFFCLHNLKYTNVYFYLVIFIRFWFCSRLQPYIRNTSLFTTIQRISQQETYPQCNVFVLRALVMNLDIIHDYSVLSRETFTTFLKNGNTEMKLLCLSRIKTAFKEMDGDKKFAEWAISVLVSQINYITCVTEMIVDILYTNTRRQHNIDILVEQLKNCEQAVPMLTRLDMARGLIYRLITTENGFKMFNDCDQYVLREFHYFMYDYIYDYVTDLEDGLGVRIMQSPDNILTNPVMVDDPSIQVRPLKIQPPSHVVFHYLRQSDRLLDWLTFIPWRIEIEMIADGTRKIIDVDTEVDVTTPTPENSFFNRDEVSIHGILFDSDQQEPRSLRVPPGATLRAYLYIGTDCVINNPSCCEVSTTEDSLNPEMTWEQYVEKRSGQRRKENETDPDDKEERIPELRRAALIRDYMLHNGQTDFEEIHYEEIVPKLENVVSNGKSETVFRYAKNKSSCVWRFTMSEGDFKASDITLGRSFNLHSVDFVVDFIPHKPQPFTVPPHICGALFHTPAGRAIMKDSIQFVDMCNVMMNKTSEREEKIKDRRAALWSLAHIAVKPKGVLYLERNGKINFVEKVIEMAESDCSLSFRGSCLLVLSFLASNPEVRTIIRQCGWLCDDSNNNAICIPRDVNHFLSHVTYYNWQLPCCTHFSSSSVKNNTANFHALSSLHYDPAKKYSVPRYSGISMSVGTSVTDNSMNSSLGSRRTRENSFASVDSRGNSSLTMNFDDDTLHINKTEECPSDIIINSIADQSEITDLMQKIALLNSTVYSYEARLQIEEMKRTKSQLFQKPITLLCVHHMFSISLFPRGWRKFVFQLFDDIAWTGSDWDEFDSCAEQVVSPNEPRNDYDSSSEDIGDVNSFVFNDNYDYNVLDAEDMQQSSIQKSLNQMSLGAGSSLGTPSAFSRSTSHSRNNSFVIN